jgi:hypothetical protein
MSQNFARFPNQSSVRGNGVDRPGTAGVARLSGAYQRCATADQIVERYFSINA